MTTVVDCSLNLGGGGGGGGGRVVATIRPVILQITHMSTCICCVYGSFMCWL